MTALSVALAHYRRRAQYARALEQQAAALWARISKADLANSWAALMPQLLAALTAVQRAEAEAADAYVAAALAAQGEAGAAEAAIVADAWAGVASDGRSLDSLLMQPVVTTKAALAGGRPIGAALQYGQAALQMIVATQAADAGRVADQVAMTTHGAQGYVRMVVSSACSRCIILAGRWYRWNAGFDRHPNCRCIGIPAAENASGDLRTDPMGYFRSLSKTQQDATFGKAGAQAIRDGADMSQVVNARSGMYTASGQKLTTAGTGRRARYGGFEITDDGRIAKRARGVKAPPRLMPEEIYKISGGDRDRALALLHRYGYITDPAATKTAKRTAAGRPAAAKVTKAASAKPPNLGKYHLPGDDVEDLAKAARAASRKDAVRTKLAGGQSASTELVTLPGERRVVTKRSLDWGDKSPEVQADVMHDADAEHLASVVGRAIGAPVVRVYQSAADRVWIEWAEGRPIGDLDSATYAELLATRDGKLIGLLDHLIGNNDRNGGNLLVNNGRMIGIDHGYSWLAHVMERSGVGVRIGSGDHYARDDRWISNPLTQRDIRVLAQRLEALRPQFAHIGRGSWLDYSLQRLAILGRHANGTVDLIA